MEDAVASGRARNISEAAKLAITDRMGEVKSKMDEKLFKMMHTAKTNKMIQDKNKREGPKLNKMQKDVKVRAEAIDKLIQSMDEETINFK